MSPVFDQPTIIPQLEYLFFLNNQLLLLDILGDGLIVGGSPVIGCVRSGASSKRCLWSLFLANLSLALLFASPSSTSSR